MNQGLLVLAVQGVRGYMMTEEQWLVCADPIPMLKCLRDMASTRKLRLFSCACARRLWPFMPDESGRRAVEAAEVFD